MATPTPNLGYGQRSEASIDQVNIWMRSTPWYQQQMRAWGQDPGHPTLTKNQSQQILKQAQANGVVVDEGNMEVDDHGNFNPIGHKLRNTLIVAGIAAATIATMGAAGAFGGAAALGPSTAANMAATSAVVGGAGVPAGIAAATGTAAATSAASAAAAWSPTDWAAGTGGVGGGGGGGGGVAGLSYADLLHYGLPTAGNLINGFFQRNDQNNQFAAQQKYLEEALAYQKEQDAFNRQRQSGLDQQNVDRYGYTTAIDAAKYGDSQQQYLADFARNENRYAYATDLESSRYGDYAHRIAPYLQSGASANDRMTSLLGLPAGAPYDPTLMTPPKRTVTPPPTLNDPGTGFHGTAGGGSGSKGVVLTPEITARVLDNYKTLGVAPTGRGTGPTDSAYYADEVAKSGGLTNENIGYWFGPNGRVAQDLAKAGAGH